VSYTVSLERGSDTLEELYPIYAQHYAEMAARLTAEGHRVPPFAMRTDSYRRAWDGGWLLNFVARSEDGTAVGYANVYLTNDMHNGELIAQEDAIYVLPQHRKGLGRRIAIFVRETLKSLGVRRLHMAVTTDSRVAKLWERMGAKPQALAMVYEFEELADV